jgi:hypothetical protein
MLSLYTWFPLVILIAIYMLIGRFYQRFSGKRTSFRFFIIPIVLLGISYVRYASIDMLIGDFWGDIFAAIGGISLIIACTLLTLQMMRKADS